MNHKKKYIGHPFRKKWGQNFLTDKNLLERIVKTIEPKADDNFLEIGPGEGALTDRIFPKVNSLVDHKKDFEPCYIHNSDYSGFFQHS